MLKPPERMPLSPPMYHPTAEEEAYGLFVFHKLFGTLPSADGTIQVETRTALKILKSSGVDRILLRTIVNVANPVNSKALTTMDQFHVIMRLIVLAQDGLLEQEINRAFEQKRNQTTPAAVFQKTLWMSSELIDFPLAKFEGVPVPTDDFLRNLSNRIQGTSTSRVPPKSSPQESCSSAPAPSPLPAPGPATAPVKVANSRTFNPGQSKAPPHLHRTSPLKKPPIDEVTTKKRNSAADIQSAMQQIEAVGVYNNAHDSKDRKPLDHADFELLQRIITDSSTQSPGTAKTKKVSNTARTQELSEEQALQQAIYESTHDAASPKRAEPVSVAAAAAPNKSNWLRMDSLSTGSDDQEDNDSDAACGKKKVKKGDEAYAAYLASLEPSSENASVSASMKVCTGKECYSQKDEDYDKKPAAKPSLKSPPQNESKVVDMQDAVSKGRAMAENESVKVVDMQVAVSNGKAMARKNPPENAKSNAKLPNGGKSKLVDQYPQAVQELVINGFELEKAIQGYKMLGDNFDDIVLFLTSNMTVKELVINGFNIHKVVKAYDLMGDNMDELLAYLMTTE